MRLSVTHDSSFLKELPHQPGVYRFYKDEEVLYVGKAINLHKRVKSYFQKSSSLSPRISLMVSKITAIEYTVVENEVSALILENNLIKSLKPRYNIVFRDDKSYPLICLTNHAFPRIQSYRGSTNTGFGKFFGPYPNPSVVRQNIDTIQKVFKIRTCSDNYFKSRNRPCMLHQINCCTAPCVNKVTPLEYKDQVDQTINFLEGKYNKIIEDLNNQMNAASENFEFEKAAIYRDKIKLIKDIKVHQIINNNNEPINADLLIVGVTEVEAKVQVVIFVIMLRHGNYVGDKEFVVTEPDITASEVVEAFLQNTYLDSDKGITHILTTFNVSGEFRKAFQRAIKIKIENPPRSLTNLEKMGETNLKRIQESYKVNNILKDSAHLFARHLGLEQVTRIECIDVSHHGGENAIAGLVVYKEGRIDNSEYRKYNIDKSVKGDDLLAMQIVLNRRFKKIRDSEESAIPDIILIDGGINQLRVAKKLLIEFQLYDKIKVAAICKGEKRDPLLDRLILPEGEEFKTFKAIEEPLLFKILHALRDEAHRFAITGHKKAKVKKMQVSALDELPNIGARRKRQLLTHFGSVKNIANATLKELECVDGVGAKLAWQIFSYFHVDINNV